MKTKMLVWMVLSAVLIAGIAPRVFADLTERGEGSFQVISDGDPEGKPRILPLKHTSVRAEISGFVAKVNVTQIFTNPSKNPIEAVYVFPLPENSAVNKMLLKVGKRVIKGKIKKREEAKQIYEDAKAQGKTAALLDQERPNIFTQSVANIPPGKKILVTLTYIQDMSYDNSVYKFVFPMVVGPRFIPGNAKGRTGTGWADDTDRVTDASRITPPVLRPNERSGHDIAITVKLDAGIKLKNIHSPSHKITVSKQDSSKAEIALDTADSIPNKDFILTYKPAGDAVQAAVLAHKTGKDGYLTLMIQPKAKLPLSGITPKELVIAIDVSGSMGGFPLDTAKRTALKCLDGMNPNDTFQIMTFASGNKLHFASPLKNTSENISRAKSVINTLRGGGGTRMLEAIQKALEFPKDSERLRIVLFMTDGLIGNEREILALLRRNDSRVFPLGVGSSPNRYLLEEMAVLGRGTVQYVRNNMKSEKLEKLMEDFHERIAKPCITDLSVDWKGLDILDATPALMPDLFAGQPVFMHARYREAGQAGVVLKGKIRGKPWQMKLDVKLPEKEKKHKAMGPLWARTRIKDFSRKMYKHGRNNDLKDDITRLALKHQLVSEYTSFVAVDDSGPTVKGKSMTVPVAVRLPHGTQYAGFFGSGGKMRGFIRGAAASFGSASIAAAPAEASSSHGVPSPVSSSGKVKAKKEAEKKSAGKAQSIVADLAKKLLMNPSKRLARQLISLQDAFGTFKGPDDSWVSLADHALAVLALKKAKKVLGQDAEDAFQKAWEYLKKKSPAGMGFKQAVTAALKGSPHWSWPKVRAEVR